MTETSMTREEILANPKAAEAALASLDKAAKSPLPDAPFPPDDFVTLPGGLMHKGTLIKHAVVRELTGEDEIALARAIQNRHPFHFLDTLLQCGLDRLGNLSPEDSERLLPELLTGDRDEIVLGIRAATYGEIVEVFGWVCPACGKRVDKIEFSLKEDVTRTTMKDPAAESSFEVKLRKGASAKVRLATGAVNTAMYEMPDLLTPQRDDILLSKCIETYTDTRGQTHLIAGFPSMVQRMSAPDRRKILTEMDKRQPGPRYNDLKFRHDECGEEVTLALGITELFRDLIIGLV
jgi:hypothetical protein